MALTILLKRHQPLLLHEANFLIEDTPRLGRDLALLDLFTLDQVCQVARSREEFVEIDPVFPHIVDSEGEQGAHDQTLVEEDIVQGIAIVVQHYVASKINVLVLSMDFFRHEHVTLFDHMVVQLPQSQSQSCLVWQT